LKEHLSNKDEVMKMLPTEMRTQFEHGMAAYTAERTKLVTDIVANSNEQFKEEDLTGMEMPMLYKIHKSVAKTDYSINSVNGIGANASDDAIAPMMIPTQTFEKE